MNLRSKLIRLAHKNPELRGDLLPLLARKAAGGDPKVDPALVAEARGILKKMEDLDGALTAFGQKAYAALGKAEAEYQKQSKVLDEDLLERYSDLLDALEGLVKLTKRGDDRSVTKQVADGLSRLEDALDGAKKKGVL